jgi:archaeal flagellin FlaB
MKKEAAFSGLEAAIVLIAFVVVAAVFSYVMLGAGFFATQKSQEVTYSGIKQSTSNLVFDGYLYASTSRFTSLTFYVKVPEAGDAQSIVSTKVKILYARGGMVAAEKSYDNNGLLNPGARTKIVLYNLPTTGPGSMFTVELKPQTGAPSLIQRTLASGYNGGIIF